MLENLDKIMHLHFNFNACPMHSPFRFVHLTHQNLSARASFCLNSLAKVNTQLLFYKCYTVVRFLYEGWLQILDSQLLYQRFSNGSSLAKSSLPTLFDPCSFSNYDRNVGRETVLIWLLGNLSLNSLWPFVACPGNKIDNPCPITKGRNVVIFFR